MRRSVGTSARRALLRPPPAPAAGVAAAAIGGSLLPAARAVPAPSRVKPRTGKRRGTKCAGHQKVDRESGHSAPPSPGDARSLRCRMAPLEAAKLPPNAAPAHLFGVDTAPANRLVVYSRDRLRAALHNALATCALDDVRLCVHRGACVRLSRPKAWPQEHQQSQRVCLGAGASLEWRDEAEGQGMTPAHLVVRLFGAAPGAEGSVAVTAPSPVARLPGVHHRAPGRQAGAPHLADRTKGALFVRSSDSAHAQHLTLSAGEPGGGGPQRLHAPPLRGCSGRRGPGESPAQGGRTPGSQGRGGPDCAPPGGAVCLLSPHCDSFSRLLSPRCPTGEWRPRGRVRRAGCQLGACGRAGLGGGPARHRG